MTKQMIFLSRFAGEKTEINDSNFPLYLENT